MNLPTSYGIQRAINEMRAIFSCQWQNGMLPHIRFVPGQIGYRPDASDWSVPKSISGRTGLPTSGITQPPIVGLCLYELFRKLDTGSQALHYDSFIAMAEGVERYHDWLFRERDPWRENLVLCLHPWETGTDNSPAFEPLIGVAGAYIEERGLPVDTFGRADTRYVKEAYRPTDRDYYAYFGLMALFKSHSYNQAGIIAETPFLLQDALFNTLLVASLQALAKLQGALAGVGMDSSRADQLLAKALRNSEKARAISDAICHKLWDETDGLFYSYNVRGEDLLRTSTVSSLTPLMADVATGEQAARLLDHASDPDQFWTATPLPSTAANSPAFDPQRYWSGPSWPVTNWLVYRGLRERGSPLAEKLRLHTLSTIAEGLDAERVREAARNVLERHSYGEEFTTPSNNQYAHAWLWDSAIVAMSWPLVTVRPASVSPQEKPGFWEYYHPHTGKPLGASPMTWTASLYLELSAADHA